MRAPDEAISVERYGGAALVGFGSGQRLNTLTTDVRLELRTVLAELDVDPTVRSVVLRGRDGSFCAGQDLLEHREALEHGGGAAVRRMLSEEFHPLIRTVAAMRVPTIAWMEGVAAGAGLGLALACDLRIADGGMKLTTAFTNVGLGPDSGTSWLLRRAVGDARARDLLLRPRMVRAQECLELGLLTEVVDDDRLQSRCSAVAESMASGPTAAFTATKECLHDAIALDTALLAEEAAQGKAAASADHTEAVEAFLEKRSPVFSGH